VCVRVSVREGWYTWKGKKNIQQGQNSVEWGPLQLKQVWIGLNAFKICKLNILGDEWSVGWRFGRGNEFKIAVSVTTGGLFTVLVE
jgi:hypothetical protein